MTMTQRGIYRLKLISLFPHRKSVEKSFTFLSFFPLIGVLSLFIPHPYTAKLLIWLPSLALTGLTLFCLWTKKLTLTRKTAPFIFIVSFTPLGYFLTNTAGPLIFIGAIFISELHELIRNLEERVFNEKRLINVQDDLTTKLMIEGINLSTSINHLSYILDNMKQSFFIVDEGMVINNPISKFSEEVFGQKILGKKIFDTLYQEIKVETEEHALITFCWETIFNADETQWIMINNQFPSKVEISSRDGSGKKVLKVSYYPIWNEQKLLSNMMMVVDDITEMNFLEKKMIQEKEISNKRITILHELTSNKRSTLKPFFHQLDENLREVLKWSKLMRESIKRKK